MSARDVAGLIIALKQAASTNDESVAADAAFSLVGEALSSLSRIADALEVIAANQKKD